MFATIKTTFRTEIRHLETSTCDPLKYTMGSPILIVSICIGKSIRIQRVNSLQPVSSANNFCKKFGPRSVPPFSYLDPICLLLKEVSEHFIFYKKLDDKKSLFFCKPGLKD